MKNLLCVLLFSLSFLIPGFIYAGKAVSPVISMPVSGLIPEKSNAPAPALTKPAEEPDEKLILILLWVFLGTYGIHRLYARKYATGVIMLVLNFLSSTAVGIGYYLFLMGGLAVMPPLALALLLIGLGVGLGLTVWRWIDLFKIIKGKLVRV